MEKKTNKKKTERIVRSDNISYLPSCVSIMRLYARDIFVQVSRRCRVLYTSATRIRPEFVIRTAYYIILLYSLVSGDQQVSGLKYSPYIIISATSFRTRSGTSDVTVINRGACMCANVDNVWKTAAAKHNASFL